MGETAYPVHAGAKITVSGHVQGVGYRWFTLQAAAKRRVTGGVRNLDDGRVEIEVEGAGADIELLIVELKQGPARARVERVDVLWRQPSGRYVGFQIWS